MELNILEGLKAIVDLKLAEDIAHFDIYKNQYLESTDEKHLPWDRPALFFEIMPYTTDPMAKKFQKANISIRIHLVTDNKSDTRMNSEDWKDGMKQLYLKDKVFNSFEGMAYSKELDLVFPVAPLANGEHQIFNSLNRRQVDAFTVQKTLNVSIQTFTCLAFDYAGIERLTIADPRPGLKPLAKIKGQPED